MKEKKTLRKVCEVPQDSVWFASKIRLERKLKIEEILGEIERVICVEGDFVCTSDSSSDNTRKKIYISLSRPWAVIVKITLGKREVYAEVNIEYLTSHPITTEFGEFLNPFNKLSNDYVEGVAFTNFF